MVRVSGPKVPFIKSATAPPKPTVTSVAPDIFGNLEKDTVDVFRAADRVGQAIMNGERPSNFMYRVTEQSNFWYMYNLMDWYVSEVSVVSTVILRSVSELFRHDISFEPRFSFKCEECGHESQTYIDMCPRCRSTHLRRPDETQLEYFKRPNGKSFLDEANNSGQSLKDVLRSFAESEYRNNEGYILTITGDIVDKGTGRLSRAYPLEFIAYDPKFVMNLHDETGTPGRTYAFVREDRNALINLDKDEDALQVVDEKGLELYPAYWKVGESPGATGRYFLYTQEEVYHDHWFRPSLTYGIPIWFDIEDDLLTYHFIEKHFHKRYKFGIVRKMVILPGFKDEDVEDITKGIQDILATNDNSIPIICTPPQLAGTAEMRAQTLELGTEDASQAMQIKNDIRDRICAHVGAPNIFVGDAEASGGMNNESQQITIFDRYLMDKYNAIDRALKYILSWFPSITDWELCINRPSKAHTDAKRRLDKIGEAQLMKSLGFDITYMDGEFRYSEEPIDQIQRKEQETMMAQQQQMAMMGGGMIPGDGDGPPEKGTARREDPEIGDSKDEIDLSKREAEDSME